MKFPKGSTLIIALPIYSTVEQVRGAKLLEDWSEASASWPLVALDPVDTICGLSAFRVNPARVVGGEFPR